VLVLGEHLRRLRGLAEALLRVGCRVEIAALPNAGGAESFGIADHRLTVLDTIQLGRPSADAIHAARAEAMSQPIVAVAVPDGARHRFARARYVVGRVNENGDFLDAPQVVRDIRGPSSVHSSARATCASIVSPGTRRCADANSSCGQSIFACCASSPSTFVKAARSTSCVRLRSLRRMPSNRAPRPTFDMRSSVSDCASADRTSLSCRRPRGAIA
jgi:hypothetical protein